jgi:putative Mg2+ transporter-C (MgtC) family protein
MEWEPFWRMLFAAGLSVPIGLDRELRGKSAGLRTHVVVATASAALGYVSVAVAVAHGAGTDAGRIAAQVVSGIGFMGAGVIFASGDRVHGLTTAAALWAASAVGLCVGLSADSLAVALLLVTFAVLWPLDWLAAKLLRGRTFEERTFFLVADTFRGLTRAQHILAASGAPTREIDIEPFGDSVSARLIVRCRTSQARRILESLRDLDELEFVSDHALLAAGPE